MKNLFFLIITLFTINCKSQTTTINILERYNYNNTLNYDNGSLYLKDINNLMNPYVGSWKWTEGNREIVLTLIKQVKHHYTSPFNYYKDRIVGYYTYKENGVIIINTSNENLNSDLGISVLFNLGVDSKVESSSFADIRKEKYYEVWLELISPTQMKFHGKMGHDAVIFNRRGTTMVHLGTSFPLEMTFVKQ